MADFDISLNRCDVPEQVRAKALARAYAEILSWPDPREKKTEPAAENLARNAAAGSENSATTEKADAV